MITTKATEAKPRRRYKPPVQAETAQLLARLIAVGPQTTNQLRSILPELHHNVTNTLVRNGFIAEDIKTKITRFRILPKGRQALQDRRDHLAKVSSVTRQATDNANTSHPDQLPLELQVAGPRAHFSSDIYNGAELLRPAGIPPERFAPYSIPSRIANRQIVPKGAV